MNYLQTLLALDATALARFDFDGDAEPPRDFALPATSRLVLSLWREAVSTATFVAVSQSIANALAKNSFSRAAVFRVSPQAFQTYALPQMPIYAANISALFGSDELSHLGGPYQDLDARVALARRMACAFAQESLQGAERTVDLATLQDALAKAGDAALAVMAEIVETGRVLRLDSDMLAFNSAHERLADLLLATAQGAHPCVESDGCVVVPGWAERRHHSRYSIEIPIEIRNARGLFEARTFDAGQGGLGLDDAAHLKSGEATSIALPDGRVFEGRVAWVAGSRAGVTFSEPIDHDDPLLNFRP